MAVRFGPGVEEDFSRLDQWGEDQDMSLDAFPTTLGENGEVEYQSNALSGGERNRLFLHSGENFKDVSLVSGIDFREDGRGFVLFDYNRDGWLDLGISSPNAPRFRIAENRMAKFQEQANGFVEVSLVGGQTSADASTEWTSRDAFGTQVVATFGEVNRMFQLSCGEGLSIQNSKRIHIGLGQQTQIDKLEVLWPSGKTSVLENVKAGERITISERGNQSSED